MFLHDLAKVRKVLAYRMPRGHTYGDGGVLLILEGEKTKTGCIAAVLPVQRAEGDFATVQLSDGLAQEEQSESYVLFEIVDVPAGQSVITVLGAGEDRTLQKYSSEILSLERSSFSLFSSMKNSANREAISASMSLPVAGMNWAFEEDNGLESIQSAESMGVGIAPSDIAPSAVSVASARSSVQAALSNVRAALVILSIPDPGPAAGPKAATAAIPLRRAASYFQAAIDSRPGIPGAILVELSRLRGESYARANELIAAAWIPWPFVYGAIGAITNAVYSIRNRAQAILQQV